MQSQNTISQYQFRRKVYRKSVINAEDREQEFLNTPSTIPYINSYKKFEGNWSKMLKVEDGNKALTVRQTDGRADTHTYLHDGLS